MTNDENSNVQSDDVAPDTSDDRPVFSPDMIQENAQQPDVTTPEHDNEGGSIKSTEE
jgi:hypothetical protein